MGTHRGYYLSESDWPHYNMSWHVIKCHHVNSEGSFIGHLEYSWAPSGKKCHISWHVMTNHEMTRSDSERHGEVHTECKMPPLLARGHNHVPCYWIRTICNETSDILHFDLKLILGLILVSEKIDSNWKQICMVFRWKSHWWPIFTHFRYSYSSP